MKTIIETERLVLRELTMDDLPAMLEITGDDETMAAMGGAWSEQENIDAVERQIRSYKDNGFGRWAAALKENGRVIGYCGIQWCNPDWYHIGRVLELGYAFNRAFWRKGYAAEAAAACKRYAFDVLGFDEVFSLVRDTNYPSMNVAIRNGMLVRTRFVRRYNGVDMPHYIFSARKADEQRERR